MKAPFILVVVASLVPMVASQDFSYGSRESTGTPNSSPAPFPGAEESLDISLMSERLTAAGFFSSGFLAKTGFIWFEKDAFGHVRPGDAVVLPCKREQVYRLFDEISVTPQGRAEYKLGDTVDFIRSERMLRFQFRIANLVRPVARGKVVGYDGKQVRVQIHKLWDVLRCQDRMMPARRFAGREIVSIEDPQGSIEATIFDRLESTESAYLYHTFILDRGAAAGVREGDLFRVYPVTGDRVSSEPSAMLCAVLVESTYSCAALVKMHSERLTKGDKAVLAKRVNLR